MKLYNPFKPHYCEFGDGQFGMRKLSLIFPFSGWLYLDTDDMHFWSKPIYSGSKYPSLEAVKAKVDRQLETIKRAKDAKKSRRVS
jgi:hypothetical protein